MLFAHGYSSGTQVYQNFEAWSLSLHSSPSAPLPTHLQLFYGLQRWLREQGEDTPTRLPGSVLGPQLGNMQYNSVLEKLQAAELETVVYTDNTLVVVSADTTNELEAEVYEAVWTIRDCLEELGHEINVSKTDILLFHDVQARGIHQTL
mgnify:CR=1 FL=1